MMQPSPYRELLNVCDGLTSLGQAKELSPQEFEAPELGEASLGREVTFGLSDDDPNEKITVAWLSDRGRLATAGLFETEHPVLGIISFSKTTESIRFFGDILVLDKGQLAINYRSKIDDPADIPDFDDFAQALGLDDVWEEASADPDVISVTEQLILLDSKNIPALVETLTWTLRNLQTRDE